MIGFIVGGVFLLLVAGLAVAVATKPKRARYVRGATMQASPEAIFALVQDFREWPKWSPWEGLDPQMKRTFGDVPAGVGATYHWLGNKKVGEGRMTILEATPGRSLKIRLEFIKPFASVNETTFKLTPKGGGTHVEWIMESENTTMTKLMSVFMNFDKMIGRDFEKGLSAMEAAAAAPT